MKPKTPAAVGDELCLGCQADTANCLKQLCKRTETPKSITFPPSLAHAEMELLYCWAVILQPDEWAITAARFSTVQLHLLRNMVNPEVIHFPRCIFMNIHVEGTCIYGDGVRGKRHSLVSNSFSVRTWWVGADQGDCVVLWWGVLGVLYLLIKNNSAYLPDKKILNIESGSQANFQAGKMNSSPCITSMCTELNIISYSLKCSYCHFIKNLCSSFNEGTWLFSWHDHVLFI